MAQDRRRRGAFDRLFAAAAVASHDADYVLLGAVDGVYAARTHQGFAAVVFELSDLPTLSGRRAAGVELLGHNSVQVSQDGRTRQVSAAAIICSDQELMDTFCVLADDVVSRTKKDRSWASILAVVDEWLALLKPSAEPSPERELGLWGELWFISRSNDIQRLLAGWRGPDADAVDFFVEGVSVEVKTSRVRNRHVISQAQVISPAGTYASWILSLFVRLDQAASAARSIPALVDNVLDVVPDRPGALRRIAKAGYSPADRRAYTAKFVTLESPRWYAIDDVPRVRQADRGVSNLRYQVDLDEDSRCSDAEASRLCHHFAVRFSEPKT
jgi:hypothetical protein